VNILIATRQLARNFPTKLEGLAAEISKSPTSLRHEISGERGNKLGCEDVIDMTNAARAVKQENALVILEAIAACCGCEIKELPGSEPASKVNAMVAVGGAAIEFSELIAAATDALADGEVTDNELKKAQQECSQLISKVNVLMAAMAEKNTEGKRK
jgi:hypothetical protein